MNTILIVLPILTILMFQLGLELRVRDFALLLKRPKSVIDLCFAYECSIADLCQVEKPIYINEKLQATSCIKYNPFSSFNLYDENST